MEYKVNKESKLLDYLMNNLGYKRSNAKNLLSYKQILVNNKLTTKFDYELHVNDTLTILKNSAKTDIKNELDIIYEDDEFVVINKKAGLLSMASDNEKIETAYHKVREYLKNKNESIYILHRIDADTSGVLAFCKKEKTRNLLRDKWNDIVLKRGYYALVEGKVLEGKHIENYLKENRTGLVYSVPNEDKYTKKAITEFEVIKANNKYSLLDVNILTGRKNQIRVTLKDEGHPIVGDEKYGQKDSPIKRLGLHAYELSFINPSNKKAYHFVSDMPNSFNKLF